MRKLRIYFSKTGDAKYISHLDLMRCMTRAIARAGIPITYTEGFNPRPYMNFAMPLSIFLEGLREIVDIKVDEDKLNLSNDEILERLSKAMPPDIKILEIVEPIKKASEVAFSKYRIEILQRDLPLEDFNSAVLELVGREELLCSKMGKKGKQKVVKYINLTEHIKDFKIWTKDDINVITLILPSNPSFGINPNLLTDKRCEELNISPIFIHITRKQILDSDYKELR